MILTYRHRIGDSGDWQDESYPVGLDTTPCHLGGERSWFLCPARGCGKRVAILYGGDPRAIKIAAAAARLNELRENWLNPADLVDRVPEVVSGYPDRILPKDDAAAKELKKRTLTNLYNARPAWLDHAHKALDEAVAEAYGWGDDWPSGALTDDEILARLFRLNQDRAAAQPPVKKKSK